MHHTELMGHLQVSFVHLEGLIFDWPNIVTVSVLLLISVPFKHHSSGSRLQVELVYQRG